MDTLFLKESDQTARSNELRLGFDCLVIVGKPAPVKLSHFRVGRDLLSSAHSTMEMREGLADE